MCTSEVKQRLMTTWCVLTLDVLTQVQHDCSGAKSWWGYMYMLPPYRVGTTKGTVEFESCVPSYAPSYVPLYVT